MDEHLSVPDNLGLDGIIADLCWHYGFDHDELTDPQSERAFIKLLVLHERMIDHLKITAGVGGGSYTTNKQTYEANADTIQGALGEDFRGVAISSPEELPPHLQSLYANELK